MNNDHDRPSSMCGDNDEDAISRNLKRVYESVASEPLPDSLQSLLDKLKHEGQRE